MSEDKIKDLFEQAGSSINSSDQYTQLLKKRMMSTDFEYLRALDKVKVIFKGWLKLIALNWVLYLISAQYILPFAVKGVSGLSSFNWSLDGGLMQIVMFAVHGVITLSLYGNVVALILDLIVNTGYEENKQGNEECA